MRSVSVIWIALFLVLCTRTSLAARMAGGKLFENGTYSQVRGVNVISVIPPTSPWAVAVSQFIESSKELRRWYSPLPLQSWHVTVHPLFTEFELPPNFEGPARWDEIVDAFAPALREIRLVLEKRPIVIHPRFEELVPGIGVLALRLSLPSEEAALVGRFWKSLTNASRTCLMNSSLGEWVEYGLGQGIDPADGSYTFHVTLGYLFQSSGSRESFSQLLAELRELDAILSRTLCPGGRKALCPMETEPAKVCWFESMTQFTEIEWSDKGRTKLAMFGRNISALAGAGFEVSFIGLSDVTKLAILVSGVALICFIVTRQRVKKPEEDSV